MNRVDFVPRDRDTSMLLPPNLQDWLPKNHLARFIVEVVEQMDLSHIEDSYSGQGGRRPFAPKMLVALLLYGYATGIFSSRKLEQACLDSVAFRYISANTSPDHDTIAAFRKRVLPYLPDLFLHVLRIAKEVGMLSVGTLSVDGTKIKANASKHHALSHGYTTKLQAKLRREIAKLMSIAERSEKTEQEKSLDIPNEIRRREDLIKSIAQARKKIEAMEQQRIDEVKKKYEERIEKRRQKEQETGKKAQGREPQLPDLTINEKAQINLTDEESRIMPTSGEAFVQGYNAQAGVSTVGQFIVTTDVVQAPNDKEQIIPFLAEAKALPSELGTVENVLGDTGYFSRANTEACERDNVVPYLAVGRQEHHSWLDEQLLDAGSAPTLDDSVARLRYRLKTEEGRGLYRKRKSTVETAFGVIKSALGFRSFLLRGLENVQGEWKLVCAAYNLKHLFNVLPA
jgi:transposase